MKKKREENSAWDEFVAWCQERGVSAVPANPWTLAAYARWCEPDRSQDDIAKAFKTIFRVHNSKTRKRPDRDPLVVNILAQIGERAREKKEQAKDKRKPLFPDDDILDQTTPPKGKQPAKKAAPSKAKGAAGGKKPRRGLSPGPKLVSIRKLKK